jgi:sodium/proline symporter
METILMLVLYFVVIFIISIVAYKSTHTDKDYILGGRNLGSIVTALGVGASDMSGWLMLGLPGAIYLLGFNQLWMPIGLIIGAFINWQLIAKRLRVYTEVTNDALTLPSFLAQRFEGRNLALRVFSALVILVAFTFYCAAGLVGGAKLFSLLFEVSYTQALLISAPVIIIYTLIGGFLAVNWVDLFQGTLMLFALLIVPVIVMLQIGGWTNVVNEIHIIGPAYTDIMFETNFIVALSLLAWGLGYFGQPHILVRFMAARSLPDITTARNVCMIWMILCLTGAIAVGLLGRAFFINHPELLLADPELVFLELAHLLFNPWIAGILLAAVLSAIMSTIAAQLMASASALEEDFYHAYLRPQASSRELLWISRVTVALVAILALVLSMNPEASVLELVAHAWGGLGATFGPVIIFALFWRRMNAAGALCGMIAGAAGIMLFGFILELEALVDVYEILPGFICGVIGILIGTYAFGKPPGEKVQKEFNLMLEKLKQ